MPYTCPVCDKKWYHYQKSLHCNTCQNWVHHGNKLGCSGLTDAEFNEHVMDDYKFFECDHCVAERIAKINHSSLIKLPFPIECEGNIFGKPEIKKKNDVESLSPSDLKKFVRQCELINNQLENDDEFDEIDEINATMVNSKYYDFKKLNALKPDKNSFGFFHANIASLNAHFDDLQDVLSRLKIEFDVIGISEHKIKKEFTTLNNISLPGYNEFIFEPTETTHGGTGFYIKQGLDYIIRNDLKTQFPF